MSRWHREHPEYEEMGWEPPDFRAAWDMERKRQKEEGVHDRETGEPAYPGQFDEHGREMLPCGVCGNVLTANGRTCDACKVPLKQVSPDRAVITDDDRELCRACGELPATRGMYCRRCDDSIRDEREMRDA